MISSLRIKIVILSTACVMVALLLASYITYAIVRAYELETMQRNLAAVTTGHALAIDEWVSAKTVIVAAVADAVAPGDPQGLIRHMQKAGGFPLTTVGWENKSFVASRDQMPANFDPTARPWYKAVAHVKKPIVTPPYADAATGKLMVSFAAPVLRQGGFDGVVSGVMPLQGVRDVVAAVHPTPTSLGFVRDKQGMVLAHPDEKFIGKPVTDLSAALTPSVMSALARSPEPLELELDGLPKLLRSQAIRGTDWELVVVLDKNDATAGMRSMLQSSALATVLLALAAAIVLGLLTAQAFRRLSAIRDAMDKISTGDGDLTLRLPVVGNDEVAHIATAFNTFVDKICAVLLQIRSGSESMRVATAEIDTGNQDLSCRTEMAASNLEQTSAALSELTGTVIQSAQSTLQATRVANKASQAAIKGRDIVSGVVLTMQDIAKSSTKIGSIISVIDSIAFQTNILALNAAVEAARAGDNGRGFAVVATEVRSLAQRSATAAKEIKALIEASESSVKSGEERAFNAGHTMTEIASGIQHVTEIIGQLSESTNAQSTRISQINQAVVEMEQSTQQNAALVEQASAASSVLHEQAHQLAQTVGAFQLDTEPGRPLLGLSAGVQGPGKALSPP